MKPIRQQILDALGARSRYWLAKEAGLSRAQVNEYLNGERDVSTEAADRMLAALPGRRKALRKLAE